MHGELFGTPIRLICVTRSSNMELETQSMFYKRLFFNFLREKSNILFKQVVNQHEQIQQCLEEQTSFKLKVEMTT